jgi:glutamate carboxypeptidase
VISGGDDAAKWLDEQAKAMETALAELVEVNSFTENTDGGRKVGEMLVEIFSSIEMLDVNRIPSTSKKFADHVVVGSSWTSVGEAPIALIGHPGGTA